MKDKILRDVLYEEIQHVFRGYILYKVREVNLQHWLCIAVHMNNKIREEEILVITGVTFFVNFEVFSEDTADELKKIFESFESNGLITARQYDSTEIATEYYLTLKEPPYLSSKEGQPELKDEIRVWVEQFLEDDGTLKKLATAVKSENLDLDGKDITDSWEQLIKQHEE